MAFRVEISPRAFNDLDEIARYLTQQASFEQAEEWFNGMIAAIQTKELGYTRVDEFIEDVRGRIKGKVLRIKGKV